jgi:hypothetical protein
LFKFKAPLPALFIIAVFSLSACSPTPTATPYNTVTPLSPPQTSTPVPTQAPTNTATLKPTSTLEPTLTPTFGVVDMGFSAWCLPNSVYISDASYTVAEGGLPARNIEGGIELDGIVQSCTFVYTFNQPMPAGMQVALYDTRTEPWFLYPLTQAADNPNVGYFTTDHEYIVNLPYWEVEYRFDLQDMNGQVVKSDVVRILRPQNVGYCYGGVLPDPVTLKCPPLPEAHPWDPWYGWGSDPVTP